MPVLLANGALFGTLCALDPAPRTLTPPQPELLVVLARIVATQLERDREARERQGAEAALWASETRLRTIVEDAPIGLTLLDKVSRSRSAAVKRWSPPKSAAHSANGTVVVMSRLTWSCSADWLREVQERMIRRQQCVTSTGTIHGPVTGASAAQRSP